MKTQPQIAVGIMTEKQIDVVQPGPHSTPANPTFVLKNVLIGVNFHWERREDQEFEGSLEIVHNPDGTQTAINRIGVEDYLTSVITSEMNATASFEYLKAHSVISRSWVLRPIINKHVANKQSQGVINTDEKRIVWYERDAHVGFDVCADDHCQRYEGITRRDEHKEASANVRKAIEETWGEVLVEATSDENNVEICDARFSKCCGGVSELFENAWANEHYDYLEPIRDASEGALPDLTIEVNAQVWIRSTPKSFCNTHDATILKQVLNTYDQETTDFYRWKVVYTPTEISALLQEKLGIDFGEIQALNPIKRGPSGRIYELEIVGSKKTMIIGKELEIRRALSKSHLYSSAFVVDRDAQGNFILTGAGWGHGVGFCQIGAAVMAAKGYDYKQILAHYFPNSKLQKLF